MVYAPESVSHLEVHTVIVFVVVEPSCCPRKIERLDAGAPCTHGVQVFELYSDDFHQKLS